jgi:hypothetical protein
MVWLRREGGNAVKVRLDTGEGIKDYDGRRLPASALPRNKAMTRAKSAVPVERLDVSSYRIPTDSHESDGTLAWDSTTLVLVTAHADGYTGIGYTYGGPSVGTVVSGKLAGVVTGNDALRPATSWAAMQHAVRFRRWISRCGTSTPAWWSCRWRP